MQKWSIEVHSLEHVDLAAYKFFIPESKHQLTVITKSRIEYIIEKNMGMPCFSPLHANGLALVR